MSHATWNFPVSERRLRNLKVATATLIVIWAVTQMWLPIGLITGTRLLGSQTSAGNEDYVTYYAAGRLVLDGHGDQIYDLDAVAREEEDALGRPAAKGVLPFFNPPFVAALFAPPALLPLQGFLAYLVVMNLLLLAAGGLILEHVFRPSNGTQRAAFWLMYLSTYALAWTLLQGQLSLLLVLSWAGFIWGQSRGYRRLSGVALALGLVKPQMVLLPIVVLVWKRQWKALAPVAVAGTVMALLSVAVAGPAVVYEYPRFALGSTSWAGQGIDARLMFGWNALLAVLFGTTPSLTVLLPFIVVTLAIAAMTLRGPWDPGDQRFLLQCGALLVASLLINAHLYLQDLALIPVLFVVASAYYVRAQRRWPMYLLPVALALHFSQQFALDLQFNHGIALVTPLLMVSLAGMAFEIHRKTVTEAQPTKTALPQAA